MPRIAPILFRSDSVLAFNLNSAMKRLVLGEQWVGKRLKAVRFALIALPGRVMRHARRLIIRLARGHPFFGLRTAIIGSEPLPIPSKTAPETLSDARSCHASPLVDTRTPPESTQTAPNNVRWGIWVYL